MYAEAVFPWRSFFLRPTRTTLVKLAVGALALIAMGLAAAMNPPHDPGECRYTEPPHVDNPDMPIPLPGDFRITQVVTPTLAETLGRCLGGLQFRIGGPQR